jgi:TetR/AcrR family transcriptional regulator, regulator of mycofactocin system
LQHPVPNSSPSRGRPPSTTRLAVERVALELFARDGFETTTMADIAAALGVGRRTLFRYFASKNDIVWGEFDEVCERLRRLLNAAPADQPLLDALSDAVVASNAYAPDQQAELLIRMRLITSVPALQAHAMLRYRDWRAIVEEFVAARRGESPSDLVPQTIGHLALGASMAAFVHWVGTPGADLDANLREAFATLRAGGGQAPGSSATGTASTSSASIGSGRAR